MTLVYSTQSNIEELKLLVSSLNEILDKIEKFEIKVNLAASPDLPSNQ